VLLVRRGQEPLLGQWSLPGGAVEVGETLEEAVVREVSEETGISVRPIAMLKTFDRIDRDAEGRARFHYVLIDFLCSLQAAALETEPLGATDVFDARWVPLQDIRRSQEFVLPGWTLEVIEQGWQRVQTNGLPAPVL